MNAAHATTEHSGHEDVWHEAFSADEQQRQLTEDSEAWRGVTGLLMAVVGIGALCGAIVVTMIALFG